MVRRHSSAGLMGGIRRTFSCLYRKTRDGMDYLVARRFEVSTVCDKVAGRRIMFGEAFRRT